MKSYLVRSTNVRDRHGPEGNLVAGFHGEDARDRAIASLIEGTIGTGADGQLTIAFREKAHWDRLRALAAKPEGLLGFTTAPGRIMEMLFDSRDRLTLTDGFNPISMERPSESAETTYPRFGPFSKRFLNFRREAIDRSRNIRVSVTNLPPDGFPIYCGVIELSSEDSNLWNPIMEMFRGGGPSDHSVILPPWRGHAETVSEQEGYFAWTRISLRKQHRQLAEMEIHDSNEPLAISLWRMADCPELREVLRRGGAIEIGGVPTGRSKCSVGTPSHAVLKFGPGEQADALTKYWKQFILRENLTGTADAVAEAFQSDLNLLAAPTKLEISPHPLPDARAWPFPDWELPNSMDGPADDDDPLVLFLRDERWRMGETILYGEFNRLLGRRSSNSLLNAFVREFWQPTSVQTRGGSNFWRISMFTEAGLRDHELRGQKRAWDERFRRPLNSRYPYITNPNPEVGSTRLIHVPQGRRNTEEVQHALLEAGLLSPPGTLITCGGPFVLDDAESVLDSGMFLGLVSKVTTADS